MSSPNAENETASTAEVRRDLRGERVIVSPGRAKRPNDFSGGERDRRGACPFCPGREDLTPPEVDAIREDSSAPNTPGWSVRVVPNKYPAVPPRPENGSLWGVHEAIIETPDHDRGMADSSTEQVHQVLHIYQRRLNAAKARQGIAYASIFKNQGPEAGASLEHPHSQLLALPFVPLRIAEELEAHRRGDFQERLASAEAIVETRELKAFCPEDARLPYEVWLAPKQVRPSFEDASEDEIRQAGETLRALLRVMNVILKDPPFHLLVYTAPFQGGDNFTWRIELVPRTARIAGFELATGVFVNQTDPAKAAVAYRAEIANTASR